STYLGGNSDDNGRAIAVDSSGNAYITGATFSGNFPTAGPIQASNGGLEDAFLAKLSASGSSLAYATYLGGTDNDLGLSIALDSGNSALIAGSTSSTNFPTALPLQATAGGIQDAFVAKVNASGSALLYSTYLGGNTQETATDIAVDGAGN